MLGKRSRCIWNWYNQIFKLHSTNSLIGCYCIMFIHRLREVIRLWVKIISQQKAIEGIKTLFNVLANYQLTLSLRNMKLLVDVRNHFNYAPIMSPQPYANSSNLHLAEFRKFITFELKLFGCMQWHRIRLITRNSTL